MHCVIEFLCTKHVFTTDDDQQHVVGKPEYLIRREQPAAAETVRLPVLGDELCDGYLFLDRHSRVYTNSAVAAAEA